MRGLLERSVLLFLLISSLVFCATHAEAMGVDIPDGSRQVVLACPAELAQKILDHGGLNDREVSALLMVLKGHDELRDNYGNYEYLGVGFDREAKRWFIVLKFTPLS